MKLNGSDIMVARLLHEDDERMTIEVGKSDGISWSVGLEEDTYDRFYTLMFVRVEKFSESLESWKPWES